MYFLAAYVLGIQPPAPGFAQFRIAPQPCGLCRAEGKVPTPHGAVSVRWVRNKEEFRLAVHLPDACPAQIALPWIGQRGRLLVDGIAR